MTVPRRIQLRRTKGWRMPANTVRVTRPGPWGNYAGDTKQAFVEDLASMSNADKAFFMDQVPQLRGKNLACWCRTCERHREGRPYGEACEACAPCHADVLLDMANEGAGS